MTELFGFSAPENQREYCYLCIDRNTDCCPCKSYNQLPDNQKFDLEDITLDDDSEE